LGQTNLLSCLAQVAISCECIDEPQLIEVQGIDMHGSHDTHARPALYKGARADYGRDKMMADDQVRRRSAY
jgi:hypothetical protein